MNRISGSLLLLTICIMALAGCMSKGTTNANTETVSKPKKNAVVDIPAIWGKPVEEIKNIIKVDFQNEGEKRYKFVLPEKKGFLSVNEDPNIGFGKSMTFSLPLVGGTLGVETEEQLAEMVGIDLKTLTLRNGSYEGEINGNPVLVSISDFNKEGGKFDFIKVSVKPQ